MNKAQNPTNDYTIATTAGVVIAEVSHSDITDTISEKVSATKKSVHARIDSHLRATGNYPERLDDLLYDLDCAEHYEDAARVASIRRDLGLAD